MAFLRNQFNPHFLFNTIKKSNSPIGVSGERTSRIWWLPTKSTASTAPNYPSENTAYPSAANSATR
jgi:hypothetical protein